MTHDEAIGAISDFYKDLGGDESSLDPNSVRALSPSLFSDSTAEERLDGQSLDFTALNSRNSQSRSNQAVPDGEFGVGQDPDEILRGLRARKSGNASAALPQFAMEALAASSFSEGEKPLQGVAFTVDRRSPSGSGSNLQPDDSRKLPGEKIVIIDPLTKKVTLTQG